MSWSRRLVAGHTRLLAAMLLCLPLSLRAQRVRWVPLAGPTGEQINCLISTRGTLFASTDGGVYRSKDQANTWQKMPVMGIVLGAQDSVVITAVMGATERSSDLGDTW